MGFCSVTAQTQKSNSNDTIQNSLKKNSLSMQFGIAANFSLQAFNDYSISVKYHISRKSAVRFGVGGNYSDKSGTTQNDTVTRDLFQYSYNYTFDLAFLFYLNPFSSVNIFFGTGPIYTRNFSKEKSSSYDNNTVYYNEIETWGVGPKLVAGGEWFFLKKLSLFAEYEAYYSFGKYNRYSKETTLSTGEFHNYNINQNVTLFKGNTARLGLSIYF